MKKAMVLLLALLMALACTAPALAVTDLAVDQYRFYALGDEGNGCFYAKIVNNGDEGAYIAFDCSLDLLDADGNTVHTLDYCSAYPASLYIAPGDYAYAYENIWGDDLDVTEVADCVFRVNADLEGTDYTELPCTCDFVWDDEYSLDSKVLVTFTNTTEEPVQHLVASYALFDEDGGLLFTYGGFQDDVIVHPGSTVTLLVYMPWEITELLNSEGTVPASVDARLYIEPEEEDYEDEDYEDEDFEDYEDEDF